ncbi:MAG: bifunctional folylpolyglutamate synthase/dihydrofolate synthase [Lachnospiraceae bacterium]|nr:bifunctional folylpolyglutamate synthase/dihydrofolate synthase [Lachnospiraceae bacterium]
MEWPKVINYQEAEEYLLKIPKFTTKNDITVTKMFYEKLGKPGGQSKIIHIAGTNGKGSVCAYLRSMLEETGVSVGMFTSPHLVCIRERFCMGLEMISEAEFLECFQKVMKSVQVMSLEQEKLTGYSYHPTFFEMLFFMGMIWYEKKKPDYIILETGLGGRLDTTNVIEHPVCTILTEIGMDHMEYLGDTIEKIAGEKAGIIKPNVPVVFADKRAEVTGVILSQAKKMESPVFPVSKETAHKCSAGNKNIDFSYHSRYYDYIRFTLSTKALYQVENAALALRTMEVVAQQYPVSPDILQKGLLKARWEGRMEEILPDVFLDGAHNEDGIQAFLDTVEMDGCQGKRILMFSVVADKDYERMVGQLTDKPLFDRFILTTIRNNRAIGAEQLQKTFAIHEGKENCFFVEDSRQALEQLILQKEKQDKAYIVGSLYLVGQIKAYIQERSCDRNKAV